MFCIPREPREPPEPDIHRPKQEVRKIYPHRIRRPTQECRKY